MQLPESIWRARLRSELESMAASGYAFEVTQDLLEWRVRIEAQAFVKCEDVKKQGFHTLQLKLGRAYPYPGGFEARFEGAVWHPNVTKDGRVCIALLRNWSASNTLVDLIRGIEWLLENPNLNDPANREAAEWYLRRRPQVSEQGAPRIIGVR